MTIGDCIVYRLASIRAVCCHRDSIGLDPIQQMRYFRHVANVIWCQFHSDNFVRASVHAEVGFAPSPVRPNAVLLIGPFAVAVNLEAGAIDQEIQGLIAVNVLWQYCQPVGPSAKCRMIRYGNGDAEHIGD